MRRFVYLLCFSMLGLRGMADDVIKTPQPQLTYLPLADVRLISGPFLHAEQKDAEWLLSLEPDRLLNGFLVNAGLEPKAPKYGGWEAGGLAGQTFGHFLSACSMMYASSGDERFKAIADYCVDQLNTCQQNVETGMLAGFPDASRLFDELSEGKIYSKGFDLNGYYVPFYNMHKLCAGLSDAYYHTGNETAKDVLVKLATFMNQILSPLSDAQIQTILQAEHGGINESLAEVYALTGDKRFLTLSERLNHQDLVKPLLDRKDELAGKHANTQIPKIVGVAREYELTGNKDYWNIASFFWHTVVGHHTYVIGGNSEAEHFGASGRTYDRITDKTCETCNSYNMLKLTKHLFAFTQDMEMADFYERVLYNHILASQNPDNGMICYMSPLASGCRKEFSSPFDSFWCCVGTGLENHARYGEFIYATDKLDNLYVNLFIPSELNWEKRKVTLRQITDFPESDTIRYEMSMDDSQRFTLNLRYPGWCKEECVLKINGKLQSLGKARPGHYIPLKRKWKNGDRIELVIPQSISSEEALGDSTLRAYLNGPIVLAAALEDGNNDVPVVVTEDLKDAGGIVKKVSGHNFEMEKVWPQTVQMKPYYLSTGDRTVVYFEHYTPELWNQRKEQVLKQRNKEEWIRQQTVSHFQPGEMQPERDHLFDGVNLELGEIQGRKYRKAVNGGSFSFQMDVIPDVPMDLMCTYWGNLGDIYKFVVEVDGTPVSTVIIHWWGNQFIDKTYHIPAEVTRGKNKVKVTFRALDAKSVAGPLFDCKILKH